MSEAVALARHRPPAPPAQIFLISDSVRAVILDASAKLGTTAASGGPAPK